MTLTFWILLGILLFLFFLRSGQVWREAGREADRKYYNYIAKKKGRHEVKR